MCIHVLAIPVIGYVICKKTFPTCKISTLTIQTVDTEYNIQSHTINLNTKKYKLYEFVCNIALVCFNGVNVYCSECVALCCDCCIRVVFCSFICFRVFLAFQCIQYGFCCMQVLYVCVCGVHVSIYFFMFAMCIEMERLHFTLPCISKTCLVSKLNLVARRQQNPHPVCV